jgi:hypothetical protein
LDEDPDFDVPDFDVPDFTDPEDPDLVDDPDLVADLSWPLLAVLKLPTLPFLTVETCCLPLASARKTLPLLGVVVAVRLLVITVLDTVRPVAKSD